MGQGHKQFGDNILILGGHSGTALAATALCAEGIERRPLDIAIHGDGHDHLFALDQVFVFNPVFGRRNLGASRCGELVTHGDQLVAHHLIELHPVGQDRQQFLNARRQPLEFVADFIAANRCQAVESQFKDRPNLRIRQAVDLATNLGFDGLDKANIAGNFCDRPVART